ncbi:hypothetical protein PIB30_074028 [Stylosanthes scabra]|uniref:Uncharacterized protein n=1 Tax=Stylosanthes scabra TaxID=79078 RepID=A0ABU6YS77_9FABA|nr:hypothetical protein [Stylosanthes scabra]
MYIGALRELIHIWIINMSNKGKKKNSSFSTVRSIAKHVFISGDGKTTSTNKAEAPSGPVATMVAASKHFSTSPHKVRFN